MDVFVVHYQMKTAFLVEINAGYNKKDKIIYQVESTSWTGENIDYGRIY